jgi:hypothetical protein
VIQEGENLPPLESGGLPIVQPPLVCCCRSSRSVNASGRRRGSLSSPLRDRRESFAAGGQSDPIGRIVNAHFQNALGQPFLMENRACAGGTIGGGQYVVRSAPDGYTLLLGTTSTFTIAPYVYRPQPYDPITNLAPTVALTEAPRCLLQARKADFEPSMILCRMSGLISGPSRY